MSQHLEHGLADIGGLAGKQTKHSATQPFFYRAQEEKLEHALLAATAPVSWLTAAIAVAVRDAAGPAGGELGADVERRPS